MGLCCEFTTVLNLTTCSFVLRTFQRCGCKHTVVIENCQHIPSNTCLGIFVSDSLHSNFTTFFRNEDHEGEKNRFRTNVVVLLRESNHLLRSLSLGDINQ